jgi:hypothetical protein
MSEQIYQSENQQLMERLLRKSDEQTENAFVTSAGGKAAGFVAKVISRYNYNHYNVKVVELDDAGSIPTVMGNQVTAVNVAESFTAQGNLAAGKYVIMFRIGEYNAFYAPV